MEKVKLEEMLEQLKDHDKLSQFCIKKTDEVPEGGLYIEANKNGILVFCGFLLKSIDREHLEKDSVYDIPDAFNDDSGISIDYIKIEEGNKKPEYKNEIMNQIGCFAGIIAIALIFLTGIVSTFQWLTKIIE